MNRSHLTIQLSFEIFSRRKGGGKELPSLMPDFAKVQDTIGTVHYSRFLTWGDNCTLFSCRPRRRAQELYGDLAKSAGPLFDAIFKHVGGASSLRRWPPTRKRSANG